jgi:peroxiredoxin
MKWGMPLQSGFVVLAAVAVYSFVSMAQESEKRRVCTPLCTLAPNYAGQNRLAPDFELESLDGKKVRLSDYRGKVVILNFWAKWCPPCLKEMPDLAEFAKILKKHEGIEFLTISSDAPNDARDTLASVLGTDVPFLTLSDPDSTVVEKKFGTKMFPETWYIDPDGVIRARFDGPRNWPDTLYLELAESLKRPKTCQVEFKQSKPLGPMCESL